MALRPYVANELLDLRQPEHLKRLWAPVTIEGLYVRTGGGRSTRIDRKETWLTACVRIGLRIPLKIEQFRGQSVSLLQSSARLAECCRALPEVAMKEVISVVQAVRRRVFMNLLLEHVFEAGFYAFAAIAAAFLVAKVVFFPNAITALAIALLAALLGVAIYSMIAARLQFLPAALAADEGLHMAERFSTAIVVAHDPSPMAAAVVLDARLHAKRINVGAQFPVALPERWWRLATALIVLVGVLMLPQFDPFGREAAFLKKQKEKEQVAKAIKDLKKQVADARKVLDKNEFGVAQELDNLQAKLVEMEKMPLGKKDALAAVNDSLEKLSEKMKEAAKGLSQKSDAEKSDLAKALGDQQNQLQKQAEALAKVKAQMAAMQQELAKGNMSKEDAQKMAEALQKMAEGLPKNSELAKEMEKAAAALQNGDQQAAAQAAESAMNAAQTDTAGIDSQLAMLAQQIAQNQQGNNNQNQQGSMPGMMGNTQISSAEAAKQIQAMVGALNGMNAFKESTTGTESMSMEAAMAQLSQAAAQGEGQGLGIGIMPGQGGSGRGSGMGGPGVGEGNTWDVGAETGVAPEASNVSGQMKQGRMLASMLTKGGQIKNESKVQYSEVVMDSKQRAKDALTDQKVPRAYEKSVREYFDSLEAPAAK